MIFRLELLIIISDLNNLEPIFALRSRFQDLVISDKKILMQSVIYIHRTAANLIQKDCS